jgi:hypothetical protein
MASMTELIAPNRQAETHSAVERIGAFAVAARPERLTTDNRRLFITTVPFERKATRLQVIEKMVRPERFELPTFWFVARRSIQLS